ncbi:MAG: hypothetical protein E6J91_52890 [Deltaproteobacteria bacterium]|nr:MAG: hypothetical protein E6J91_52890 [Deltaproteobacteria bacterium]
MVITRRIDGGTGLRPPRLVLSGFCGPVAGSPAAPSTGPVGGAGVGGSGGSSGGGSSGGVAVSLAGSWARNSASCSDETFSDLLRYIWRSIDV